jgi:hypothetical protein
VFDFTYFREMNCAGSVVSGSGSVASGSGAGSGSVVLLGACFKAYSHHQDGDVSGVSFSLRAAMMMISCSLCTRALPTNYVIT